MLRFLCLVSAVVLFAGKADAQFDLGRDVLNGRGVVNGHAVDSRVVEDHSATTVTRTTVQTTVEDNMAAQRAAEELSLLRLRERERHDLLLRDRAAVRETIICEPAVIRERVICEPIQMCPPARATSFLDSFTQLASFGCGGRSRSREKIVIRERSRGAGCFGGRSSLDVRMRSSY